MSAGSEESRRQAWPKLDWPVFLFIAGVHFGALAVFLPGTFSWAAVGVAVFLHWVTAGAGVTLGFHRLHTHRSFQCPKWLEYLLFLCGILACQGSLEWVAKHRMHHLDSDGPKDPHDIHRGFWWAHHGWIITKSQKGRDLEVYTRDLCGNPVYRFLDRTMLLWQAALAGLLYLLGGWPFIIWGIFVRLTLVYHCTWFVNSATHYFGYRTYKLSDRSTNNWWVALLTYGEGWHNNHHAFPTSARHGMKWWEIDMTWWMIRVLEFLGLAWNIKLPGKAALARYD